LCIKHSTRRAVPWGRGCRDGRLRIAALVNGRALSLSLSRERELSSVTLNTEPHPLALSLSLSLSLSLARSFSPSLSRSRSLSLSLCCFFFSQLAATLGERIFPVGHHLYSLSITSHHAGCVFFVFYLFISFFISWPPL